MLFESVCVATLAITCLVRIPGVRKKGTRNKVGLLEAFADKDTKGYNWNNMMLQRWVDLKVLEHRARCITT